MSLGARTGPMETTVPTFRVEALRELYAHMEWADAKVWAGILSSEQAVQDAVVRDKLVHIHMVQRVYLNTWTQRPWEPPTAKDVCDQHAVWRWAQPYYEEAKEFLRTATDDTVSQPLPDSFARQIEDHLGACRACPTVAESAFQVTSHSTHHRGQLNTRLRELGAEPPQFDYIAWVWFGRPAPEWKDPLVFNASTSTGGA